MFELGAFIDESEKMIVAGLILKEIPALIKVIENIAVRVRKEAIENPNVDINDLKEVGKELENFVNAVLTVPTIDLSGDESLDIVSIMKTVVTIKSLCKW